MKLQNILLILCISLSGFVAAQESSQQRSPSLYNGEPRATPRYMPGEVIVKFQPAMTKRDFRPKTLPESDLEIVDPALKSLTQKYGVQRIKRFQRRQNWQEEAVYIVTLRTGVDLNNAISEFSGHPLVTYAKPYYRGFPLESNNVVPFQVANTFALKFRAGAVRANSEKKSITLAGKERLVPNEALDTLHRRYAVTSISRYFNQYEKADGAGKITVLSAVEQSERIKQKYPKRSQRIAKGAQTPDLENIFLLKLSYDADIQEVVEAYSKLPFVEYAQPRFIEYPDLIPNDPSWDNYNADWDMNYLWGMDRIQVEQAWDVLAAGSDTPDASHIIVAVVDFGTDYTHEDLDDNIWVNAGEIAGNDDDDDGNGYPDDVRGWNFAEDNNDPSGGIHGTHVAGIISAEGNNATGVVGVSWNSKIMPLRVLDASQAPRAIRYATDNGASVINNSWHSFGIDYLVQDAVDYAHSLGVVVVASAGNQNCDIRAQNPARVANVIAVANTHYLDMKHTGTFTGSNYGVKVDVAAPGSVIYSTYPDNDYGELSGTSMSAPHVSGLAALILAYDGSLTNEQVRQLIRKTADDITDPLEDGNDYSGHDIYTGFGRINAARALQALQAGQRPLVAHISSPSANYYYHESDGYYDIHDRWIKPYFARTQVSGTIDIIGDAYGPDFQRYTLDYGEGQHPGTWTSITTSESAVENAVLGTLNTDLLAAGTYVIRLTVEKTDETTYEDRAEINIDRAYITSPTWGSSVFASINVTGFAMGPDFVSYHFEYGEGEAPATWHPIGTASESPVEDDVLLLLSSLDVSLLPEGVVTLKLVVTHTTGVAEHYVPLFIDTSHFRYQSGWPITIGSDIIGSPAVADLDGDGTKELVVGNADKLYVYHADGSEMRGWPVTTTGFPYISPPAIGDIDDDGALEIGIKTQLKQNQEYVREFVYLFENDGSHLSEWPFSHATDFSSSFDSRVPKERQSSPVFEDIDRDGILDILFGTFHDDMVQGQLVIRRADGTAIEGWPQTTSAPIISTPAVADIDNNGLLDVVALSRDGNLYVWDQSGSLQSGWPQNQGGEVLMHAPILVDLDDDDDMEIVSSNYFGGKISIYHHDGTALTGWPQTVALDIYQPAAGDIDNDGDYEIIVAGQRPAVSIDYHRGIEIDALHAYAFQHDGSMISGWDPKEFNTNLFPGYTVITNADDDAANEILLTSWSFEFLDLFGLNVDGTDISDSRWPIRKSGKSNGATTVDDLDNDGDMEIIFAGSEPSLIEIWDTPQDFDPATTHWATAHQNMRRTNALQGDASTVLLTDTSGSMSWAPNGTHGVAPTQTRLHYAQQAAEAFTVLYGEHGLEGISMQGKNLDAAQSNLGLAAFPQHPFIWPECGAEVVMPMRRMTEATRDHVIDSELPSLVAEGDTPLLAGLLEAQNMFGLETYRALILLSDGYHNCPSTVGVEDEEVRQLIDGLNHRSITTYTVGFGRPSDLDHPLLDAIATGTGGELYDVTQGWPWDEGEHPFTELQSVYKNILTDVLKLETALDPTGTLEAGRHIDRAVSINEHDQRVSFFLSWVTPREDTLGLRITSSDGDVVTADQGGVQVTKGKTYTIVSVDKSFLQQPGKVGRTAWAMRIDGTALSDAEPYQYSVILNSALKMQSQFQHASYVTGDTIVLEAKLTQTGKALAGAKNVVVQISRPMDGLGNWFAAHPVTKEKLATIPDKKSGERLNRAQRAAMYLTDVAKIGYPRRHKPVTLRLYDDASHGDLKANDGIYTNRYNATNKEGVYRFHFQAHGVTDMGYGYEREQVVEKYLAVAVDAGSILVDAKALRVADEKMAKYQLLVTPKDRLGNYLGPRRDGTIQLSTSGGRFIGALQDRLNGSYSQVLEIPVTMPLNKVEIGLKVGKVTTSYNLAKLLK